MTANPQIVEETLSPFGDGKPDHDSETTNTTDTLKDGVKHEEKEEIPGSSSGFRHSCMMRRRPSWIELFALVVVIGLCALGVYTLQMDKESDDDQQPPNTHIQIGSDLNGEGAYDEFGSCVALSADGTRIAIGSPFHRGSSNDGAGHVRVYDWTESKSWTQVGSDLNGAAAGDRFGSNVALSADGTRVAIGAPYNDGNGIDSGHVRIYHWTESQWTQMGSDLNGAAAYDEFGSSVALSSDGTRVAIGAVSNKGSGSDAGQVRVYDWTGSQWKQVGSTLNGEAFGDELGSSVALSSDGTRMAIGAPHHHLGDSERVGHVRVFDWTESQWTPVGSDLNGEAMYDVFGSSVALSSNGTRVAIGAPYEGGDNNGIGHVRVYDWTESEWTQVGSDLNGETRGDTFGSSVALSSDGTRVAIGAPLNNGNGVWAGHVRVYDWTGSNWTQVGSDLNGEAEGDWSGWSVALSSDGAFVAIGAILNDDNGYASGHVRVYNVSA